MIFPDISDPATLEAMACREALALAADLNLQRFCYRFRLPPSHQQSERSL
jgi:hypothetical protein